MTHTNVILRGLERQVGRGYDPMKVLRAFSDPDEKFQAGVSDGEEAGYHVIHAGCGGEVDLYGGCLRCGGNIYWEK